MGAARCARPNPMQTFLPYPVFGDCAFVLDDKRLGKQRVEVFQIARALLGLSKGWRHHPATVMWDGHVSWLLHYGEFVCAEWTRRGYTDTVRQKLTDLAEEYDLFRAAEPEPYWLGDRSFHSSHRAALLHKNPEHYQKFGWTEAPTLAYVWPR